jgi:hypothetical protein
LHSVARLARGGGPPDCTLASWVGEVFCASVAVSPAHHGLTFRRNSAPSTVLRPGCFANSLATARHGLALGANVRHGSQLFAHICKMDLTFVPFFHTLIMQGVCPAAVDRGCHCGQFPCAGRGWSIVALELFIQKKGQFPSKVLLRTLPFMNGFGCCRHQLHFSLYFGYSSENLFQVKVERSRKIKSCWTYPSA